MKPIAQLTAINYLEVSHIGYKCCNYFCVFLSLHQRTPLHIAATEGREKTVEFLIEEKARIDIQDNEGVGI